MLVGAEGGCPGEGVREVRGFQDQHCAQGSEAHMATKL